METEFKHQAALENALKITTMRNLGAKKTLVELHWGVENKGNSLCFPCEHRSIDPEMK